VSTAGSILVSAMALAPQVPAATQDYVAAGEIACLASGDEVTVSVLGADGYTSSATATASEGTLAFSVGVPGGAAGVRDTIAVQVKRGGTLVASRTASLVFS
jgi:protein involved in polysaccharide export with SLBB domain